MARLTLVIGNKNYSSWSLRPWFAMKQTGIPFDEVRIPLYREDSAEALARWSPSGLVPLLRDGDVLVWDSLAICEYLNERDPELALWPSAREARAMARAVSAEMHSGFSALRHAMPMNCRIRRPGQGWNPESRKDIERIRAIWQGCRSRFGDEGPFLFGRFSIADAMFAPVVLRFHTYDVALDGLAAAYAQHVLSLSAMQAWLGEAMRETEVIEKFELGDTR